MKQAILLSVQPYFLYLKWLGKKTKEIRKCKLKGRILCYCTKKRSDLKRIPIEHREMVESWLGKVVMMYDVNEIDDLKKYQFAIKDSNFYDILKKSCITVNDLTKYCPVRLLDKPKPLFALHIENLVVFEKTRELSNFKKVDCKNQKCGYSYCNKSYCGSYDICDFRIITRPPQSFMYCYVED